ncbi:recombinase family protein [Roseomonas sp. GCM10028921]
MKAGIEIVTLTDRRHYTWESVREEPTLLLGSIMVMMRAHEESSLKAKRISDAWARKRAKLTTPQNRPFTLKAPHWLTWNYGHKRWDLVPERVAVVRRIFELTAVEGLGMSKVAQLLNRERVPTLTGRSLNPGTTPGWHPTTVGQLLRSRTVLGEFTPRTSVAPGKFKPDSKTGVIPDYYPQIIPFDLWNRVHAVRQHNAKFNGGRRDGRVENVFRGKVFCADFGSVVRIRYGKPFPNGDRYNYWCCSAAERNTGTCTNKVWVNSDATEAGVLAGIKFRLGFWQTQAGDSEVVRTLTEQLAGPADEHDRKVRRFATLGEMLAEEESMAIRLAYRELSRELDAWDTKRMDPEKQLAAARGTGSVANIIQEAAELEGEARHEDLTIRVPARNRLMVLLGQLIGRVEVNQDRRAHVALADGSMRFDVVKGTPTNITDNVIGQRWRVSADGTQEVIAAE